MCGGSPGSVSESTVDICSSTAKMNLMSSYLFVEKMKGTKSRLSSTNLTGFTALDLNSKL